MTITSRLATIISLPGAAISTLMTIAGRHAMVGTYKNPHLSIAKMGIYISA